MDLPQTAPFLEKLALKLKVTLKASKWEFDQKEVSFNCNYDQDSRLNQADNPEQCVSPISGHHNLKLRSTINIAEF